MSGWDADKIYSISVLDRPDPDSPEKPSDTERLLQEFLLQYRVGSDFIYRRVLYTQSALKTDMLT